MLCFCQQRFGLFPETRSGLAIPWTMIDRYFKLGLVNRHAKNRLAERVKSRLLIRFPGCHAIN
ncbi:MAG: hypothetical protein RL563_1512 [Pseudomonadota bacterium]|jgi:hypothetical protein